MKLVSVHEAKSQLSALLAEIERTGEEIVICRHKKPIANLVPHKRHSRVDPHPVLRDVGIDYDPTEPMASDEWPSKDDE
ncbi:MAG: prevent-host-death protein [Gemmatimonadaceae bacterium]|nr:prevent-host-death protein [Gemmatimonadaceae bacterium]